MNIADQPVDGIEYVFPCRHRVLWAVLFLVVQQKQCLLKSQREQSMVDQLGIVGGPWKAIDPSAARSGGRGKQSVNELRNR